MVFSTTGGGSYIIASTDGSTLTLANYGSPAPVTVSGGNHTISAPMTLNDNLNFSANPGSEPDDLRQRQRRRSGDGRRLGHSGDHRHQ